jgi:hypothetical protein
MTKCARELKRIEIRNAGSKKVPILLIGSSKTRSGRRFRNKFFQAEPAFVSEEETEEEENLEEQLAIIEAQERVNEEDAGVFMFSSF